MIKKYVKGVLAVMIAVVALSACENKQQQPVEEPQVDPREAFVGDYSYVTSGDIDLSAGVLPFHTTVPLDYEGEMSITLGDEQNTLWVKAEGDSTVAYVSGNQLFFDPITKETSFGDLVMHLSFTLGKATLEGDQLSLTSDVEVSATYMDYGLSGNGKVDIVATKKVVAAE